MRGPLLSESAPGLDQLAPVALLLVDDVAASDERLLMAQSDGRFRLLRAGTPHDFEQALREQSVDLIVSDLRPWGLQPLELLDRLSAAGVTRPVVIMTAQGNEALAVEAIKRGAADYLGSQPLSTDELAKRLSKSFRTRATSTAMATTEAPVAAAYGRILNALSVNAAFLDASGTIRMVNRAWRHHAYENPFQSAGFVEGMNYLEICEQALAAGADGAEKLTGGIGAVIRGERDTFAAEYPYHAGDRKRWFKVLAGTVREGEHFGAIVVHVEISDRKRAEEERDRMFEQSLNLFCIIGLDGYMKRWNPAWCGVLGYPYEEMMSLPLAPLVHPEDIPTAVASGKRLLEGRDVTGMEVRIRCKDGNYKWILWNAVPCLEQKVYFATGQDITVRKQYEQQLRESQERFELIASATKEAIWDWDLRADRIWRNEAYESRFGAPGGKQSPIEWWRDNIHPDDRERILGMMPAPAHDETQQWALEYRMRRLDGTYAHVFDRGYIISDPEGQPVRMVGSIMDVSALKNAEAKLRESEERFRLAGRATRDAIWDWDLRKGHVWRSEGFHTLFGYELDEVGVDIDWWLERIHEDDRQRVLAEIPSPGTSNSQQCNVEYRFRRADGSYADVFDRGFVMLDEDGQPARMIGTIMDVSERRRAEEVAHMHRAELAHIARVSTMGEIATGLAHELNQPLTAISNYAESCLRAIQSGERAGDEKLIAWLDKIAANTHRAAEMIRRLRGFTRKSEPKRSTVVTRELVEEVIDLLEAETRLQNMRVRWEPLADHFVTVDRIQIQQVLVNLLRNAYEAMASNSPCQRTVTIRTQPQGGKLEVSVEDLGEGIDAENLERVFEAFFTNKPNGLGVGLAISRSIVEDHGGRLWVTPNPEQGVTFRFTLPMSGESDVHGANRNGR